MKTSIGLNIRTNRNLTQLKQEDLSCDILDRTTLSKIENGHIFPSIPQLVHISQVLHISADEILYGNFTHNEISTSSLNKKLKFSFDNKQYNKIIDNISPYDFITTYYVALSYYKLDCKLESIALLAKCEDLFILLNDSLKPLYAENLAISIVTLRKLIISSFDSDDNLRLLKKAAYYLEVYNLKNCRSYMVINNNIGAYYIYTAKYKIAIEFYEKFLEDNISILPSELLANIHLNLNISYFSIKCYDNAIDHGKKSILFFHYTSNIDKCAGCHLNLFNAYLYKNDISNAYNIINEVLSNFEDIDVINIFRCCELVLLYNINKTDEILIKKKSINYGILRESTKIDYDFILGHIYFNKNNYKSAANHYNKCKGFLVENKRYMDAYIAYNNLYIISKNEDFKIKALQYKQFHDDDEYNHISINITSPSYFLYNK